MVPMDIDSGVASNHSGTDPLNSGAAESHSGTPQVMSAEHMSAEPMDIDAEADPEPLIPTWAQPIFDYLKDGTLLSDETLARKTVRRAKAYTIINKELYKRSVTSVLQRCISPEKGQEILLDIHQGECGHHASSRALVAKAFRHGFYWPSALAQAQELVGKCSGCQHYASKSHLPASELKTIPITWRFEVRCLDMVGPFKPARGGMTHMLVMIDNFTK